MITNDLLIVTMGISFYLVPLLLLFATLIFVWRARLIDRGDPDDAFVKNVIRDPVTVTIILALGGLGMVWFLTGRLSLSDYLSVPRDALNVLWRSFTEWEDPFSSASVALRGGLIIAVASVVIIAVTTTSYFRARLRHLSEQRLG